MQRFSEKDLKYVDKEKALHWIGSVSSQEKQQSNKELILKLKEIIKNLKNTKPSHSVNAKGITEKKDDTPKETKAEADSDVLKSDEETSKLNDKKDENSDGKVVLTKLTDILTKSTDTPVFRGDKTSVIRDHLKNLIKDWKVKDSIIIVDPCRSHAERCHGHHTVLKVNAEFTFLFGS